ncbi:MAG: choice-of-anchor D domain-containing protein, partial [Acidobacteria bacterium]|nr:choice-of-anchor D domain-containing protein [Acidobacteriota bacterium]
MRNHSAIAWGALVLLLAVPAAHAQQTAQAGVITALKPRNFIGRGQQPPQEAARGDQILWEDIIQTERGGRVRIGLLDGSILNIGSEARVQILRHDAATQQSEVLLNFGKMRALVRELGRPDSKFEVRTNTAVAGVIGTDEFIDASNPAYTCALSLGGVIFLRSDDLSIPGIEVLYPGEKSCVEEGQPPEPKRPATDEELQDALHSTAPTEISLQPAVAFPGTTVSAELTGQNLLPLESLTVSGEGVNATPLLDEATPTRIPLRIEVSPDAPPGLRLITLRTPAGEETVDFVVLPPPGVGLALELSPLTTPDTPFVLLRPGPQGPFQITPQFEGPSPGPVTFTLVGLPPGISHRFSAPQALPGQTIQLYFELTGDVSPGDYVAALGARAGLFAAAAAIYLRVPPPAGTPVIEVEVEHYPSPEQPPEILTGTEFRVWLGARLVFDASPSSVPGGELTGFNWQVLNTPVGATGPRFELDTWQLTPGTYRILLQATSNFGNTAQQEFRLAVLALPNPDEVPYGLGRGIETLQVNEYMKWFHLVLFRDYPGLEERTRNSFQQLSAARVYVRLDNRQRSGYDAFYQVTFEIEFSTRDNPEQSQRRRESVTLRLLFLPGEGVWRIVDFAVTVSEIPGELILATLELTTDPPTSETTPLELALGETTELHLTVSSDTVAGLVNLTAAAPPGLTVGFGASQVAVNSTTDVFLTASPDAAAGLNQVLITGQTSSVGGSVPIFLNITARPAVAILNVNPTSVDFGDVPVGSPTEQIVTVTNTGNADLILTDAAISGSRAFSLPLDPEITPPVTLPPGGSIELDVHFLPTAPGVVTGTLTIVSSNAGSAQVALAGTGIQPQPSITGISSAGPIIAGAQVTIEGTGFSPVLSENVIRLTDIRGNQVEVTPVSAGSLIFLMSGGLVAGDFSLQVQVGSLLSNTFPGQLFPHLVNLSPTSGPPGTLVTINGTSFDPTPGAIEVAFFPATPETGFRLTPLSVTNTSLQFEVPASATLVPHSLDIDVNGLNSNSLGFEVVSAGVPEISVNPASLDFGSVVVGTISSPLAVTVTNPGTADLILDSLQVAPSPPFAKIPQSFPITVPPGGSHVFDFTFGPLGTGLQTGTVTFSSNAGSATVALSGTGISAAGPILSVSPLSVDFGDVVVGTTSSPVSVTVMNAGSANLTVNSVFFTGSSAFALSAPLPSFPTVLPPGGSFNVGHTFSPSTTGLATGTMTVSSDAGTVDVPFSGNGISAGVPAISASPTSINFGDVAVGSSSTVSVTISNVGSADLFITNIDFTSPSPAMIGFFYTSSSRTFTLTPGQNVTVNVAFQPPSVGPASDQLQIDSNAPSSPTFVPLSGNGVAAVPQISVSPTSLDFGDVVVGSSSLLGFTISNVGTADLVLGDVSLSCCIFVLGGLNVTTLVPGQSDDLTVSFSPPSVGSFTDAISIDSNDPATPIVTVPVSGNGVAAGPQISVSPTSLDFGSVFVGSTSTLSVSISNVGTADLIITNIDTPCGALGTPFECGFALDTSAFACPDFTCPHTLA